MFKRVLVSLIAALSIATPTLAQQQTGEIFGKVVDPSGAVMPGVTVTLTSPILLQPLVAVSSETGTYQFPRLEVADYTVKFELAGFRTVVNEGIHITAGFSAQVNAQLAVCSRPPASRSTARTLAATCRASSPTTYHAAARR